MDMMNALTFVTVANLLVISPGPNGVLIAKTVPLAGRKAGFANVLGFIAAFYVHGTLSIFGISLLLVQSAQAFFIFKTLGAMYLCWIGLKSLISAWGSAEALADSPELNPESKPETKQNRTSIQATSIQASCMYRATLEGFLTNALNPKVSMFYLAAFPQFVPLEESVFAAYTLVSLHAVVNFIWFSFMVIMLHRLQRFAASEKFKTWLKSVTGIVFIAFGAKLAFLKRIESTQ